MKKSIKVLLVLVMMLGLAACGNKSEEDETPKREVIETGKKVVTKDTNEFVVEAVSLTHKIVPANPAGVYTYYSTNDGEIFLDALISYTNTSTEVKPTATFFSGIVTYKEEYYQSADLVEIQERNDLYLAKQVTNIESQESLYLHVMIALPIEVLDNDEPILLSLTIDDTSYDMDVRKEAVVNTAQ